MTTFYLYFVLFLVIPDDCGLTETGRYIYENNIYLIYVHVFRLPNAKDYATPPPTPHKIKRNGPSPPNGNYPPALRFKSDEIPL